MSMSCVKCGSRSQITDSREVCSDMEIANAVNTFTSVRRTRRCLRCGAVWHTEEKFLSVSRRVKK